MLIEPVVETTLKNILGLLYLFIITGFPVEEVNTKRSIKIVSATPFFVNNENHL